MGWSVALTVAVFCSGAGMRLYSGSGFLGVEGDMRLVQPAL